MPPFAIFDETPCSCDECMDCCRTYACLPTPREAKALVDAGYGEQMMLDTRPWGTEKIFTIMPAMVGFERKLSPMEIGISPCVFFNDKGLCDLHDLGLKPMEGRAIRHDTSDEDGKTILNILKSSWAANEGKEVVALWKERYYHGN